MATYHLPSELWIQIFQWATIPAGARDVCSASYEPFTGIPYHLDVVHNLSVRRNLVLVCRRWKSLATEFLYRDLIIKSNSRALQETLWRSDARYGKLVRRVILPYTSTMTPSITPLASVEVLKMCSSLKILVRPPVITPIKELLRFEFEASSCPTMDSLMRLDWWHNSEASRSRGINRLEDVLLRTPNLQYLFIGGVSSNHHATRQYPHLPALTTLHIRLGSALYLFNICRWSLPSLTTFIGGTPMGLGALDTCWETFGHQLRTVEFGKSLGFFSSDNITRCLRQCPELQELYYHVAFTMIPNGGCSSPSLQCVGLCLDTLHHCGDDEEWAMIQAHIQAFKDPLAFPSLKEIRLWGRRWINTTSSPRWPPLYQLLVERGISTEMV